MADKRGYGTKTEVASRFSAGADVVKAAPSYTAQSLRQMSFDLGAWHVENGWPTPGAGPARPVVGYDITPDVVTFPAPSAVTTNADVRWIGQDFVSPNWPSFSGSISASWLGTGTSISNYRYITNEITYSVPGVRLDPDAADYLTANLTALTGTTYTLILVFKPYPGDTESAESDDETTYGLWAPATAATGQPELRIKNDKIYIKQSSELSAVAMTKPSGTQRTFSYYLRRQQPTYLVFTAGPERFFVYTGTGPSTLERWRQYDVHDLAKTYDFRLGSYAADITHTANITVFDVNFYNQALTSAQIVAEVQLLSAAYGGDV